MSRSALREVEPVADRPSVLVPLDVERHDAVDGAVEQSELVVEAARHLRDGDARGDRLVHVEGGEGRPLELVAHLVYPVHLTHTHTHTLRRQYQKHAYTGMN